MKLDQNSDIENFREILSDTKPSDFDGHTEFPSMSLEERILWLSESSQFAAKYGNSI